MYTTPVRFRFQSRYTFADLGAVYMHELDSQLSELIRDKTILPFQQEKT